MHSTSLSPGTSRYPQSSSHPFQTNKQLLTKYVIGCVMKVSYFCTTCWWINHESLSSGTKHTKYVVTWHGMIQSCLWSNASLFTNDLLLFTFLFCIAPDHGSRRNFSPPSTVAIFVWNCRKIMRSLCPLNPCAFIHLNQTITWFLYWILRIKIKAQ